MISADHSLSLPWFSCIGSFLILLLSSGCVSPQTGVRNSNDTMPVAISNAPADLDFRWGIRVESLRLSAHGHILDFRYRVLDPDKAAALADGKTQAYLINEVTGERLKVPNMPKVGPLRSTTLHLEPNRVYIILFANPGSRVVSGNRVTVEIGDFKAEHLVVE